MDSGLVDRNPIRSEGLCGHPLRESRAQGRRALLARPAASLEVRLDPECVQSLNQYADIVAETRILTRASFTCAAGFFDRTCPPNFALIMEKALSTLERLW